MITILTYSLTHSLLLIVLTLLLLAAGNVMGNANFLQPYPSPLTWTQNVFINITSKLGNAKKIHENRKQMTPRF